MSNAAGTRVVVVGAGIVGASLAYHLASNGADVTLVEAASIASGVTATSFAWITASHSGADPIAQLRGSAIGAYQRLEEQVPDLKIRWTGALSYGENGDERLQASDIHPSAAVVSRSRILDLEPNLKHPPRHAFYNAEEGALDAVQATHALVSAAQAQGAKVLTQTRVLGFTTQDATVTGIKTASANIDADIVVLAAGTGITHLTGMLNAPLPIEASPAIFIRYMSRPHLVRGIISNAEMEVRQNAEGVLLAAEDYLDETLDNQPEALALRTAKAIQEQLHGVGCIQPDLACVGLRPMPVDGVPIIGYLPNIGGVYVCALHPGVALAAIVGRLASEEMIGDKVFAALEPCRPDRFFQT